MCSIMGYFKKGADRQLFEKGFAATVSRGPDDSRITEFDDGILGFHRLAIMGLTEAGMQPFTLGLSDLLRRQILSCRRRRG